MQRTDSDHHTNDAKRTLKIVEVHASLESANTAAESHFAKESKKAVDQPDLETDVSKDKDGGFQGTCWTRENKRDHFDVVIKKMELKGSAATGTAAAKKPYVISF